MSSKKKHFYFVADFIWSQDNSACICWYFLPMHDGFDAFLTQKKYVTTFNMYWFVLRKYQSRKRNFHLRIALTQQNPKVLVHNYSNSKKILKTTTNLSLINEIDFKLTTNPAGCCYWKFLVVISSTGCRSKTYQR